MATKEIDRDAKKYSELSKEEKNEKAEKEKEMKERVYVDKKGEEKIAVVVKRYNRGYSNSPIIVETREQHEQMLLNMLKKANTKGLPALVTLTTIKECDEFALLLRENGLSTVQILDDKKEEKS